jgi:TfoX/Sxy family transcriptional regulator of competence genes
MAKKETTITYLLDRVSTLHGIRAKKMFGEYALYYQDKVVALVCDDELFVKITQPGKKFVSRHYTEGFPYPGAKPAMRISADLLEDKNFLCKLIRITAHAPKI